MTMRDEDRSGTSKAELAPRNKPERKRTYCCEYPNCSRLFSKKYSLNRHMLVHTQDKQYSCAFCGKKFALPHHRKEHEWIHTQSTPYICGVAGCTQRFRQAGKLSLHRRTHPEYKLRIYRAKRTLDPSPLLDLEHSNSDPVPEAHSHSLPEPLPEPPFKSPALESRALLRQGSGQTVASTIGNEELPVFDPQPLKPLPTLPMSGVSLTKEALEAHDALQPSSKCDPLELYLSVLHSSLASAIRFKLPRPRCMPQEADPREDNGPKLTDMLAQRKSP